MGGRVRDRVPLTRERILAAAIDLGDREGLQALSMRRLGGELGVEAMSLYKHIASKGALIDGIVGVLLAEMDIPPANGVDWQESIRMVARTYRRIAHLHPNLFPLVVTRPLNAPEVLEPLEATLAIFRAAGFDVVSTLRAFRAISSYVEGYALDEITGFSFTGEPSSDGGPRLELDRLDPEAFPCLREFAPYLAAQDRDAEFEFGLQALLFGVQAHRERT